MQPSTLVAEAVVERNKAGRVFQISNLVCVTTLQNLIYLIVLMTNEELTFSFARGAAYERLDARRHNR